MHAKAGCKAFSQQGCTDNSLTAVQMQLLHCRAWAGSVHEVCNRTGTGKMAGEEGKGTACMYVAGGFT